MNENIMRFFGLAVLGILTGVLGTEEVCRFNAHNNCRVYSIIPRPFPSNEEELQTACLNLTTIKECITEYVRNCSEEGHEEVFANNEYRQNMSKDTLEWEANMMRRILRDDQRLIDVSTEICQEDSVLHASVVSDIPCYRNIFEKMDKHQICRNYTTHALNYLQGRLDKMGQERRDVFDEHYYCLMLLFEMNCSVNEINKSCSSLAKDTVLEIIEKGFVLDDHCPVSIHLDILEMLDDFNLGTKEDIYVKQLLKTD